MKIAFVILAVLLLAAGCELRLLADFRSQITNIFIY